MQENPWWAELLGVPALICYAGVAAAIVGIAQGNSGFTIVGVVVAVGAGLAIGLSMKTADRE